MELNRKSWVPYGNKYLTQKATISKKRYHEFHQYLSFIDPKRHIDNDLNKNTAKMAKMRVNWHSIFSYWVSKLLQMHKKITWHSLGIADRKAGQQFQSKAFICQTDMHSSTAWTQTIIDSHSHLHKSIIWNI